MNREVQPFQLGRGDRNFHMSRSEEQKLCRAEAAQPAVSKHAT